MESPEEASKPNGKLCSELVDVVHEAVARQNSVESVRTLEKAKDAENAFRLPGPLITGLIRSSHQGEDRLMVHEKELRYLAFPGALRAEKLPD